MLKRSLICACAVGLLLSFSAAVYGASAVKPNTTISPAEAIEVISPKVGNEKDVVLKKDKLYVNIRLKADYHVFMTLNKIDPPFYLGTSQGKDNGQTIGSVDGLSDADKQELRPVVLARYIKAQNALEAATKAEYPNRLKEFNQISAIYGKLFAHPISGPTEVKVSDVLPYFKTEIDNVKSAQYQIVFTLDKANGKVIKTVEFTVTSSAETVDKIKEAVPENMNKIWTTP